MMSPTSVRTNRRGITLIEMLVVIGILTLLAGILLPAVMRVMRSAERTRAAGDLQTISVALEAYHADFGDYPRSLDLVNVKGSQLLVHALIGPYNANPGTPTLADDFIGPTGDFYDGFEGAGFKTRRFPGANGTMPDAIDDVLQGKTYGPYIPLEKFKFTNTELQDRNGNTILYIPARPVKPNINAGTGYVDASDNSLYDNRYIETGKFTPANAFNYLIGDVDDNTPTPTTPAPNGRIDTAAGETPATTGPYILWSAGPDGIYGTTALSGYDAGKCDDVTNFK